MVNKKYNLICMVMTCMLLIASLCGCGNETSEEHSKYAVLLGRDAENLESFPVCDVLVIDGEYFTKEDIEYLKERGTGAVYSYLNIGSLEEFRDYYEDYSKLILGQYEDWPDEGWIDVSDPSWQEGVVQRGEKLKDKGFDGLFIDNTDVYYNYPRQEIYDGLVIMLQKLRDSGLTVIINGGDTFVSRYISENSGEKIFDGINQEDVYTRYDFDTESCGVNTEEEKEYFTQYCRQVLAKGYIVYTLEYADDKSVQEKAYSYSQENGFICCVSDNINLE